MEPELPTLRRIRLFSGLDDELLEPLRRDCRVRWFARRFGVFAREAPADCAFGVLSGHVRLSRQIGSKRVLISLREPGDTVGLTSAIDGGVRTADAETIEACELVYIPAGALRHWCFSDPRAAAIAATLTERLRQHVEFQCQQHGDVLARVAGAILTYARIVGKFRRHLPASALG